MKRKKLNPKTFKVPKQIEAYIHADRHLPKKTRLALMEMIRVAHKHFCKTEQMSRLDKRTGMAAIVATLAYSAFLCFGGPATAPMPPTNSLTVGALSVPKRPIYESVTLAWNVDASTNTSGYNLYFGGASQNYTNMLNCGNSTQFIVSNLIAGLTYYFAVTAYSAIGLESQFSTELAYTIPMPVTKPQTNVFHFLCLGSSNMQFSATIPPHWSWLGTNRVDLTNPTSPMAFYRGLGMTNWRTAL